jgi:site-specific recombinase XerD
MSERSSQSRPAVADEVEGHLTVFLETLANAGYAEKTRHDKERLIVPFIRWVREAGIAVKDVDEACVESFLACPSRCRYHHRTALQHFVEHLRIVGAVPQRRPAQTPADGLFQKYLDYLRDTQGLSPHSIEVYSPFVRVFVVAQRLPQNAAAVDALAVRHHLLEHCRHRSVSAAKLLAAALRSFLRFCFLDGMTTTDLATAVIPVHRWQYASVPAFLTAEDVEQVIVAADGSTTRRCRDYAILMLLARLGLRASEVIALELDDIQWKTGEIVVRGKGRLHDRLPLLDDVGEALARYLSKARGPSSSRCVFLRHIAPLEGLAQPSVISKIAREALRRAGLLPTGRVGAHIFRHSLATRMLRHGASLEEISQVLRHRSTTTTQLYAKVEFERLRDVARPWPSAEVPQ